ncbi:hypothetical protein E2C01_018069 [Portunus trituberculatus]|uniref:Uncharacterized protein n=1 Tax=Portunus trituberculatus TaxID=210409 RepID=A0A5B7DUI3_PORTR|nr:hypothetical protein [Portunus trituberculatus]
MTDCARPLTPHQYPSTHSQTITHSPNIHQLSKGQGVFGANERPSGRNSSVTSDFGLLFNPPP